MLLDQAEGFEGTHQALGRGVVGQLLVSLEPCRLVDQG